MAKKRSVLGSIWSHFGSVNEVLIKRNFAILCLFEDIDECASGPCQNGGVCSDSVNDYTCTCASAFIGANCENGECCFKCMHNILY